VSRSQTAPINRRGGYLSLPPHRDLRAAHDRRWSPGLISCTGPRPCGYLNLLMVAVAFSHSLIALTALHSNAMPR